MIDFKRTDAAQDLCTDRVAHECAHLDPLEKVVVYQSVIRDLSRWCEEIAMELDGGDASSRSGGL